jgi:hypothetical protein
VCPDTEITGRDRSLFTVFTAISLPSPLNTKHIYCSGSTLLNHFPLESPASEIIYCFFFSFSHCYLHIKDVVMHITRKKLNKGKIFPKINVSCYLFFGRNVPSSHLCCNTCVMCFTTLLNMLAFCE